MGSVGLAWLGYGIAVVGGLVRWSPVKDVLHEKLKGHPKLEPALGHAAFACVILGASIALIAKLKPSDADAKVTDYKGRIHTLSVNMTARFQSPDPCSTQAEPVGEVQPGPPALYARLSMGLGRTRDYVFTSDEASGVNVGTLKSASASGTVSSGTILNDHVEDFVSCEEIVIPLSPLLNLPQSCVDEVKVLEVNATFIVNGAPRLRCTMTGGSFAKRFQEANGAKWTGHAPIEVMAED